MTDLTQLSSVLEEAHRLLDAHGIWHCLAYGTLLGAVRGGAMIEWDHDIDLQVRPRDIPRLLALSRGAGEDDLRFMAARADASGLALNPGAVRSFDPQFLIIARGAKSYGEAWAPSLFSDGVLRLFDFDTDVLLWAESSYPHFFVEELESATVAGHEYPVPRHAERLLEGLYGIDWRVPSRAEMDGGTRAPEHTRHGTLAAPTRERQVAWCRARGWDQGRYRGQPAWPRELRAAGPPAASERTAHTSGSAWWHTIDELLARY